MAIVHRQKACGLVGDLLGVFHSSTCHIESSPCYNFPHGAGISGPSTLTPAFAKARPCLLEGCHNNGDLFWIERGFTLYQRNNTGHLVA